MSDSTNRKSYCLVTTYVTEVRKCIAYILDNIIISCTDGYTSHGSLMQLQNSTAVSGKSPPCCSHIWRINIYAYFKLITVYYTLFM